MKTILNAGLICAGLIFNSGCKKEIKSSDSSSTTELGSGYNSSRTIKDVVMPADANAEMIRIYEDLQDPDYEVAIIDNPNYGKFSLNPGYDIILLGKTLPTDNISIVLNDNTFSATTDGQWFLQNSSLKSYIGKNVEVKIMQGTSLLVDKTVYVTKAHLASKLGAPAALSIGRTGNTITWASDASNLSGKIILFYQLYDASNVLFDSDAKLLNDSDGSYNLDGTLANTSIARIQFSLISGNTVSTMVNGKKLLFYINTRDHHEYSVN